MNTFLVTVVGVGALVGAASPALGQSTRRPDLNEFGRGLRNPQQSMGVRGNLGATFYDRLTPVEPGSVLGQIDDRGWGLFGSAALVYQLRVANVSFDGTLGAFASYYPETPQSFRWKPLPGAGARAGWSWSATDKTQLTFDADLGVRSVFTETIFSGSPTTGAFSAGNDPNAAFLPPETSFIDGAYLTVGSSVGVRHTFSRRWSASTAYRSTLQKGLYIDESQGWLAGGWEQDALAMLHFGVTRNLSIQGGYRYRESRFANSDLRYRVQGFEGGFDYGRGLVLELARGTTLGMNAGVNGYIDNAGRQRYRVVGDVRLSHEFQRTWLAVAAYTRGIEGTQIIFREPLLTDTFIASLNGLFRRGLGAHATAYVQGGALAFASSGARTLRAAANAGLQQSLSRQFAASVDYTYYHYRFDEGIARPVGLPARSASHGIHAYVSAWVPVFQRGGRTNAAR